MAESQHAGRCLLVTPVGHDPPLDLLDGLRRRGVTVREVQSAPDAMARLAAPPPARPSMVVIIEPAAMPNAPALAAAIRRYFPRLALWRYAWGAQPPLAPWSAAWSQPCAAGETTEPVDDAPAPDDAPPDDAPPDDAVGGEADHETLLTDPELAMLLDEDWPDPASEQTDERHG